VPVGVRERFAVVHHARCLQGLHSPAVPFLNVRPGLPAASSNASSETCAHRHDRAAAPQIDLICLPQLVITAESPAAQSSRIAYRLAPGRLFVVERKFDQLTGR
jgi:hypothetical protein